MMTIKDCIDMVDAIKPNQYTIKDKVSWLSFIDEIIINEVLKTHEGYDGRYDAFEGYSEDKLSQALIVPSPYDRVYTAYLKMKIDQENGEVARYNNSATLYNSYMAEFRKHYNKTHMPIDVTEARKVQKKPMASSGGMSEAEYENLVRDLTYILTEHFSDTLSHDKLYDVVMEYAQNNVEMLRGKDGEKGEKGDKGVGIDYILISDDEASRTTGIFIYDTEGNGDSGLVRWGKDGHTPQKGVDYWTDADKAEILSEIPKGGTWETIADITIPDGFASYSYTITSATYPDMAKITDFYIAMTVPKQSDGLISGALQVQLQTKTVTNIARFGTWNHASYVMKGFVFSKLYGNIRHNQYYGFSANATMDLSNNSLLGGLDVGYFEAVNIALSDASKTLPAGMTIKIVGCKK